MKTSQADILILPGLGGGGADYWYARWSSRLKTARQVKQKDWDNPTLEDWCGEIVAEVEQADKPVVLIAHSLGVAAAVHASPKFPHQKVAGAYLVAVPDLNKISDDLPATQALSPLPTDPLPFPSILVASTNDPYCDFKVAEDYSFAWGSKLENAGETGHINAESGQGPWPEGLLSFAAFMACL